MLPECLDDFIAQDNTVRVVDAFIGELDMAAMGFEGATPALTGRPSQHPSVLLKVYRSNLARWVIFDDANELKNLWMPARIALRSMPLWPLSFWSTVAPRQVPWSNVRSK